MKNSLKNKHADLKADKKKNCSPEMYSASKKAFLKLQDAYDNSWQKYSGFALDANPFENTLNADEHIQVLDPICAYIFSCSMKLNTLLISDKMSYEQFVLLVISKFSQVPLQNLIAGRIEDHHWPGVIRAGSNISSKWPGHLETKYKDEISEVDLINILRKQKYETIILDFKKEVVISKKVLNVCKKMKKTLVIGYKK